MQEMKYEINEDGHAITPCRFINNKFIGSCACNECDFIISDDIVKQVVSCNYEEKMSKQREYNPAICISNEFDNITLLDLFAAASLQGLRAAGAEGSILDFSNAAYQDAKAMLDERQKVLAEIEGK